MPTVRLEGDADPIGGALDVVVHADTVRIRGQVRLPGRRLVIWAREVDAEDGELDLGGAEAETHHDAAHPPVRLCGTYEHVDGLEGDAGEKGCDAKAGGNAGRGGRGGNGGNGGSMTVYLVDTP